jgi:hypothetical protein
MILDRREFLKLCGLAGAIGLALPLFHTLSESAAPTVHVPDDIPLGIEDGCQIFTTTNRAITGPCLIHRITYAAEKAEGQTAKLIRSDNRQPILYMPADRRASYTWVSAPGQEIAVLANRSVEFAGPAEGYWFPVYERPDHTGKYPPKTYLDPWVDEDENLESNGD